MRPGTERFRRAPAGAAERYTIRSRLPFPLPAPPPLPLPLPLPLRIPDARAPHCDDGHPLRDATTEPTSTVCNLIQGRYGSWFVHQSD